ncbi:hypothetical protein PoB_001301300 [Plakobranchus ocellatus]|uniref:Ig-like domain-containing protein n=1 Tax=Plakobranchus ocellatus TaxID=259542 RepID=A0AAV3YVB9_9GAST|nr:hypothetical protein PoB_001301300 [Plakobranchus ocellatus]
MLLHLHSLSTTTRSFTRPGKAFLYEDQGRPKWLTDSDNATCNSKPNATLLHLRMLYANQNFWIRLETKNISIREITEESELQFGTGSKTEALQSCGRLEVSEIVAGRSFNIYCTLRNWTREIYIRGRVVSQICSLYVSEGRAVPFTLSAEAPTRRVKISLKSHSQGKHTFYCTSVQSTSDRKAKAAVNFAYPVSLQVLSIYARCKDAQKSASPQQVDLRLSGSPSATAPVVEFKPATKGSLQNSGQVRY